jgi:hypothetical protein
MFVHELVLEASEPVFKQATEFVFANSIFDRQKKPFASYLTRSTYQNRLGSIGGKCFMPVRSY